MIQISFDYLSGFSPLKDLLSAAPSVLDGLRFNSFFFFRSMGGKEGNLSFNISGLAARILGPFNNPEEYYSFTSAA